MVPLYFPVMNVIYGPHSSYQDASPRVTRSVTIVSRLGHCHAGIKQRKRVACEGKNDTSSMLVRTVALIIVTPGC